MWGIARPPAVCRSITVVHHRPRPRDEKWYWHVASIVWVSCIYEWSGQDALPKCRIFKLIFRLCLYQMTPSSWLVFPTPHQCSRHKLGLYVGGLHATNAAGWRGAVFSSSHRLLLVVEPTDRLRQPSHGVPGTSWDSAHWSQRIGFRLNLPLCILPSSRPIFATHATSNSCYDAFRPTTAKFVNFLDGMYVPIFIL